MKKPIRLSLIYTTLDLNALMLRASTIHWSSKFHLLITLFEKKYLVISLEHRVLTSLHECPLVPLLFSSSVKSSCSKTLLSPLYILNTSIRSCPFLLFSRVQSLKHHNLSSFSLSFLCTCAVSFITVPYPYYGFQAQEQYSTCGLNNVL